MIFQLHAGMTVLLRDPWAAEELKSDFSVFEKHNFLEGKKSR